MTIMLNGSDLTVTQVVAAARHREPVAVAPQARETMQRARAVVQEVLAAGEPVYGRTTGVGERKSFLLDPAERQKFNQRLVLNRRQADGTLPADLEPLVELVSRGDLHPDSMAAWNPGPSSSVRAS